MNLQRFILIGGADSNAWDDKMFANLIEMNLCRFMLLLQWNPGVGHRCARPTPGYWIDQPILGCRHRIPFIFGNVWCVRTANHSRDCPRIPFIFGNVWCVRMDNPEGGCSDNSRGLVE